MKVYCCQLDMAWEDKPANYRKTRALLEKASPEPGSLVILPEMFATGFSMNVAAIAEEPASATEAFLRDLARELQVFIVAGVVTREDKGLNQAVVISPDGRELSRYTKIHPFSLGGELKHYRRGTAIHPFDWQGVTVCPFICYDLRFPEIFRSAVVKGAEMFVVIADWPSRREQHWVTLLQARAIENLTYVVGVNRAGSDPYFPYPGRSMVIDPQGKVLIDAGAQEGVVMAEVDPNALRTWRKEFPALTDMHWRD